MEEHYSDKVKVESSNLSVITTMRLNSMEEDHRYKMIVESSSLSVATNSLVAQWKMYPAFNRRVLGSSPSGTTKDE